MKRILLLIAILMLLFTVPIAQAEELVIAGLFDDTIIDQYQADHPDVQIIGKAEYFFSTNALIDAITTHSSDFDVMVLWTGNQNVAQLIRKRYCVPLNDLLADHVGGMYPAIREAVMQDGKLYALPLSVTWTGLAYDEAAFAATGLSVPQSWEDVAALINGWDEQPEEIRNQWQIGEYVERYSSWFLLRMNESYVSYLQLTGQPLAFDTPLYHQLMELQAGLCATADQNPMLDELSPLLTAGTDIAQLMNWRLVPLQMEDEVVYKGGLYVAIINPFSEHQETAMSLLNYMAQRLSDTSRIQMFPNANDPVENPHYTEELASWEAKRNRLQAELDACDPANQRDCQEALNNHLQRLPLIESRQYLVDAETIEAWHNMMAQMIFPKPTVLDLNEDIFTTLEFRYLDGELPLEQYIIEMERMANMIMQEAGQ